MDTDSCKKGARLVLPSESEHEWAYVKEVLDCPLNTVADLDSMLTKFSAMDEQPKVCTFFQTVPGSADAGNFDFHHFFLRGAPLLVQLALEMPQLFACVSIPIFLTRSSWEGPNIFGRKRFTLSRRQCACLLAHSFFGSLKRPPDVERNNFRFTVADLFVGTAVSPNSAVTFLNYFTMLAQNGIPDGLLTFERRGYSPGPMPWQWKNNPAPLCKIELVSGNIEDSIADVHADFANAFIGGGVMTGDFAMEEILFLMKPELMVAMALENRMTDTEVICVSGALQYSLIDGYGSSFEFAGQYDGRRQGPPPTISAIDAIRGGGPAMTEIAMLRDMNKARLAFDGARQVATGHWGCGAFGNNHDLMFLKQWLAASEAGAERIFYHDFNRRQSHNIHPLARRLEHLSVGQLWDFMLQLTNDLVPCKIADFTARIRSVANGDLVPGSTKLIDMCNKSSNAELKQSEETSSFGSENGFQDKVVIYLGQDMLCVKETGDAQVRLQRPDGRTTWASKKDVKLKE